MTIYNRVQVAVRAMLFLCATLVAFVAYAQTGAGIWEGKIGGINPPPTLRVDFDSEMASINGGPSQAVAVLQAADPLDIQFQIFQ